MIGETHLPPLFDGDHSVPLWHLIAKLRRVRRRSRIAATAHNALYLLGCHCQRLETRLRSLHQHMVLQQRTHDAELAELKARVAQLEVEAVRPGLTE